MTNKPLERSDLFAQFAVKCAIEQYVKLNESINSGKLQLGDSFNKVDAGAALQLQKEESKDFVRADDADEVEE
jgi:hypothetical protein